MRIRQFLPLIFVFSLLTPDSFAFAVQGGASALGSQYVVPISIKTSATQYGACSGAVISSRVVATAGHCILDTTGLISKQILIGEPGSLNKPMLSWTKVSQVYVDDSYKGNDAKGNIGLSDIALLLLEKPLNNVGQITFASESKFTSMKTSATKLRIIGYGDITDDGAKSEEPKSYDSNLSPFGTADPNASITESTVGSICGGDSGSPVLSITPTSVTLVGVVTGGTLSKKCAKQETNGTYKAIFTNVSRFSNLIAKAIAASGTLAQAENNSLNVLLQEENSDLQKRLDSTIAELDSVSQELAEVKQQLESTELALEDLKSIYLALNKAGIKSIRCANKGSVKIVVGKSPVCPKGFKKA